MFYANKQGWEDRPLTLSHLTNESIKYAKILSVESIYNIIYFNNIGTYNNIVVIVSKNGPNFSIFILQNIN